MYEMQGPRLAGRLARRLLGSSCPPALHAVSGTHSKHRLPGSSSGLGVAPKRYPS
jgi:hypothetical protein